MRLLCFAALATLVCVTASPLRAADDAPIVLEPSSPWNVDFGEDKCRLARTFGGEGNRHILFFEQGGPDRTFAFTVAGPQFERFRTDRVAIRFGEYPADGDGLPFIGTIGKFGTAVIWSRLTFEPTDGQTGNYAIFAHSLPEIDLEKAAKVATVSARQGKREVIFNTGELTEAVKVLNQCAQDLLNSWGLDLEYHRSATRLPVWTNEKDVVRSIVSVYPPEALRKEEQAIIRMRVIVDETGKVADCRLVEATAVERLSSPACDKVMQKAIFSPALDRQGKPMRSFYLTNIIYKLR